MGLPKRTKKKKSPTLARKFDTKYLGDEPKWDSTPTDPHTRKCAIMSTFQWYNYFHTQKDHRKYVVQYAKENLGLKDSELKLLREAPEYSFSVAVEKFIRMSYRGWVLNEYEMDKVRNDIMHVLKRMKARKKAEDAAKKAAPVLPKVNVIASPMLLRLEELEDEWIEGQRTDFNLYEYQQAINDTKGNLETYVKPWIERRIEELNLHKDGDEQVREGLPFGARERNRRLRALEQMLNDVEMLLVKKTRTVRPKKRMMTADKQAKGFKFLQESTEYKVASVDPTSLIGARVVYMFDTKNRVLHEVVAKDDAKGLGGKGMALTGFDQSKTRKIKLRKPEEFLPIVMKKNQTMIGKEWEKLTTVESESNGRMNANTVLLRTIK